MQDPGYRTRVARQSYSQKRRVLYLSLFLCEPMGCREIFHTFSLLVELEGHFTHEFVSFVSYVYETEDRSHGFLCQRQQLFYSFYAGSRIGI
jgi:hypothetical protein